MTLVGVLPTAARADYLPTAPDPLVETVTADPLPTAQINGVAWTQVVVGNKVFVGGNFSSVRPAGAAAGTDESPRANLLAYDITTGVVDPAFAPVLNGQVLSAAKSPDGSVLYVGGQFTTVNGVARNRVAAFSTATGALLPNFAPSAGTSVRAIAATADTVYIGGDFDRLNGAPRSFIGAVSAANGSLLPFDPKPDGSVMALTMNPAGSLLVMGGRFSTIAGTTALGMAAVDPVSAAPQPWAIGSIIRTSGVNSAITSLIADSDSVYGTAYTYGTGGNFEGTFRADGGTGEPKWISDCHGDHYSVYPMGDVVYDASHSHYCGNIPGGFLQSNPFTYYASGALTKEAAGTNVYNALYQRFPFNGKPSPALLHWFPVWTVGTFTGQSQASWSVTGNGDYVTYAGEFLRINGRAQQGLVRFARAPLATKKSAPQWAASLTPALTSVRPGVVDVGWQATFDRDNRDVTYRLYRNFTSFSNKPVFTTTVKSTPWDRPTITFRDTGLTPGSTHRYRVYAFDGSGNNIASTEASIVLPEAGNTYGQAVLNSDPAHWWRMDDPTGRVLADSRGSAQALAPTTTTLTGGTPGAAAMTGTSMTLVSNSGQFAGAEVSEIAPQVFTVEAWIKTNATRGGRIMGYGDRADGMSKLGFTDRNLYMDDSGRIVFGAGTSKLTVNSKTGYNDNAWHHLVGSLGPDGLKLYVDGQLVASRADATQGLVMQGVWKIGGDRLDSWPMAPSTWYYAGSIDEAAVYNRVLGADEVLAHYRAASGLPPTNALPTAAFTATVSGSGVAVDGSASADSDGQIVSYAWDYGDGSPAETGATASHSYSKGGTYQVRLTVTDDAGGTATSTQSVTVADPANVPPTASFTWTASGLTASVNGSASADPDGSVVSWAWNFGDGSTGTGATASRTYAAAGTYPVTLTVTDNRGAATSVVQSVVVSSAGTVVASDTFSRSLATGWGSADTGGAWTISGGASNFTVANGAGSARVPTAGGSVSGYLNGVSQLDQDLSLVYSMDKIASPGGSFLNVSVRGGSSTAYRAKLWVRETGTVQAQAVSMVGGVQTVLGQAEVPGLVMAPGDRVRVRVQALGASPTSVRLKVWRDGTPEPAAWLVSVTDSTAQLQAPGALGVNCYVSTRATNAPITYTFDEISAIKP